ncbi:MAG: DUF1778 domain-containing protein [Saccharospirillum sp.]|nr:DUF1778 domain-containing protein [Saccharospirillum sp.]
MANTTERLEARIPADLKLLAERAALSSGITLTDYLVELIRRDAPKRLSTQNDIALSNEQFDQFMAACEAAPPLSPKLLETARKLDSEGF